MFKLLVKKEAFALFFAALGAAISSSAQPQENTSEVVFLRHGKPLAELVPAIPNRERTRYENAVRKLRHNFCLVEGEEEASFRLDWINVENTIDLEVCLFFSASKLKSIKNFKSMLELSGFQNVNSQVYNRHVTRRLGIEGDGYLIDANFPIENLPDHFGGFLNIDLWWAYGLSTGIYVDENGVPFYANATLNRT